jgi:hypothetical protein
MNIVTVFNNVSDNDKSSASNEHLLVFEPHHRRTHNGAQETVVKLSDFAQANTHMALCCQNSRVRCVALTPKHVVA